MGRISPNNKVYISINKVCISIIIDLTVRIKIGITLIFNMKSCFLLNVEFTFGLDDNRNHQNSIRIYEY